MCWTLSQTLRAMFTEPTVCEQDAALKHLDALRKSPRSPGQERSPVWTYSWGRGRGNSALPSTQLARDACCSHWCEMMGRIGARQ